MIQAMPRYRSMALRPIHRIKHVKDQQFATAASTQVNVDLVTTVDAPVLANTTEVETGAKVNGIYLHIELVQTSNSVLSNAYMMIVKNPGGNVTFPNANNVGNNDNKRFVIHQEMLMLQNAAASNPRSLFNGVIVIPKGMRRMAPNDLIQVYIFTGNACNVCLQAHYKEFR